MNEPQGSAAPFPSDETNSEDLGARGPKCEARGNQKCRVPSGGKRSVPGWLSRYICLVRTGTGWFPPFGVFSFLQAPQNRGPQNQNTHTHTQLPQNSPQIPQIHFKNKETKNTEGPHQFPPSFRRSSSPGLMPNTGRPNRWIPSLRRRRGRRAVRGYLHRASYVTQTAEGCGLKLWKRCNAPRPPKFIRSRIHKRRGAAVG